MITEAEYYQRLLSNLSGLRLEGIEINLEEYLRKVERKKLSIVTALCLLTDIEMKMKQERYV